MERELKYDDFKDIKVEPSWSGLDLLAAVCERASIILDNPSWQPPSPPIFGFVPKRRRTVLLNKPIQEIIPSGINISTKRKRVVSFTDFGDQQNYRVVTKPKKTSVSRPRNDDNGPVPPPPLPEEFKNFIRAWAGGCTISEMKLVIQKKLYQTDMSKTHNRFSMPEKKIENEFLNDDEMDFLRRRVGMNTNAIDVELIGPSSLVNGVVSKVSLRRWEMGKSNGSSPSISYVFTGGWSAIRDMNGLEEQMVVQLWSFRVDGRLCFALVKVPQHY